MKKFIIQILWWIKKLQNPYNDRTIIFMFMGTFISFFVSVPAILIIAIWTKDSSIITVDQKYFSVITLIGTFCYFFCLMILFFSTKLLAKFTNRNEYEIMKYLATKIYL